MRTIHRISCLTCGASVDTADSTLMDCLSCGSHDVMRITKKVKPVIARQEYVGDTLVIRALPYPLRRRPRRPQKKPRLTGTRSTVIYTDLDATIDRPVITPAAEGIKA